MPYVTHYGHLTVAHVPLHSWEEAWFSLMSLKAYLQDFPGHMKLQISAHALENGDVRVYVHSLWEYRENVEAWMEAPWIPRRVFEELSEPAEVLDEAVLEELS